MKSAKSCNKMHWSKEIQEQLEIKELASISYKVSPKALIHSSESGREQGWYAIRVLKNSDNNPIAIFNMDRKNWHLPIDIVVLLDVNAHLRLHLAAGQCQTKAYNYVSLLSCEKHTPVCPFLFYFIYSFIKSLKWMGCSETRVAEKLSFRKQLSREWSLLEPWATLRSFSVDRKCENG